MSVLINNNLDTDLNRVSLLFSGLGVYRRYEFYNVNKESGKQFKIKENKILVQFDNEELNEYKTLEDDDDNNYISLALNVFLYKDDGLICNRKLSVLTRFTRLSSNDNTNDHKCLLCSQKLPSIEFSIPNISIGIERIHNKYIECYLK